MVATFVIFLREGVEASMIIAILLAYLNRSGQRRHFRDVFAGVAAALLLAAAGGLAAYITIRTYAGSRVQTIFETATYLLAAAVLTYMTFWMRSHARGLKGALQARADAVLASHAHRADTPQVRAPVAVGAGSGGVRASRSADAAGGIGGGEMSRGARLGLGLLAFQAVGREG